MIVLDASATVELLLRTALGEGVAARLRAEVDPPHAPHILDAEVAQTLRRQVSAGHLPERRARQALGLLAHFPLRRRSHRPLIARAWDLRRNLTIYDGLYVALAESLGVPLVTTDGRLAAAPGHRARVELVRPASL